MYFYLFLSLFFFFFLGGGGSLFICFRLFITATGCPFKRRRLVVKGDSARIQDETTENSAWFFNVLSVSHRHTGPRFNERQLAIIGLTSLGQPINCYLFLEYQMIFFFYDLQVLNFESKTTSDWLNHTV